MTKPTFPYRSQDAVDRLIYTALRTCGALRSMAFLETVRGDAAETVDETVTFHKRGEALRRLADECEQAARGEATGFDHFGGKAELAEARNG